MIAYVSVFFMRNVFAYTGKYVVVDRMCERNGYIEN